MNMQGDRPDWFRNAAVYQIYPRSFCDSDGNGVGDLRGIVAHLDYLRGSEQALGVDAIWLSPFYPSPMADFGYDISDYCDVDPLFGTLDDFRHLLAEAHERGLKVLVDIVPNHTSVEHPWFKESRSSRQNPKRDWYVWRDAKAGGSPPNNWLSVFGGSAWQFDEPTGQYYLHSFLAEQPDLNWDNPEVREAIQHVLRFWLGLGVDGFRLDAVEWIAKDPFFRDDPPNPHPLPPRQNDPYHSLEHRHSKRGPALFAHLAELEQVVAEQPGHFMIMETYPHRWNNARAYLKWYRRLNPRVGAPFNFEGIFAPWRAHSFRSFVDRFQSGLSGDDVPIYCLGNHDQPRLASRIGQAPARVAAMLELALPGMTVLYYGDELGMQDGVLAPDQVRDPSALRNPAAGPGRDPERTPLAWDASEHGGFTSGDPWLLLAQDYQQHNVAAESADPASSLALYRRLLQLRREEPALQRGSYRSFDLHPQIFAFVRQAPESEIFVVLNFAGEQIVCPLGEIPAAAQLLATTYLDDSSPIANGAITLRPHEGLLLKMPA